jgi:hypothetical protein
VSLITGVIIVGLVAIWTLVEAMGKLEARIRNLEDAVRHTGYEA